MEDRRGHGQVVGERFICARTGTRAWTCVGTCTETRAHGGHGENGHGSRDNDTDSLHYLQMVPGLQAEYLNICCMVYKLENYSVEGLN